MTHRISTRSRLRLALAAPSIVVAGLAAPSRTGAGAVHQSNLSTPAASPVAAVAPDWLTIVDTMWDSVQAHFFAPEFGLYREHAPVLGDDKAFSYLWPYSGVFSAANARAAVRADEASATDLKTVIGNLEQYWDENGIPPGYDSYVVEYGGGDKFYDDNEWLGIDFVHASRLLGDPALIDKAKAMWEFALSGWDEEMGGGIYWKQGDTTTKNTCSNGPAAVLGALLYEETGEEEYLDWVIRILEWTIRLKAEGSGVYNDHVRDDGSIDTRRFTYNTGTPMQANALLYRITGEEAYLIEARELAASSLAWFAPQRADGLHVFPNTPWFNSILLRGYTTLLEVDPEPDRACVDALLGFLQHGWVNARDDAGLLHPDWSTQVAGHDPRWLLDQVPVIEIAAAGARIESS